MPCKKCYVRTSGLKCEFSAWQALKSNLGQSRSENCFFQGLILLPYTWELEVRLPVLIYCMLHQVHMLWQALIIHNGMWCKCIMCTNKGYAWYVMKAIQD